MPSMPPGAASSALAEVVFGEGAEVVHTQVLAAYSVQRIAAAAEDLLVGGAEQGLALFDRPRDPPQARRLPVLWG